MKTGSYSVLYLVIASLAIVICFVPFVFLGFKKVRMVNTYRVIGSPGFRMDDAALRAWVERSADRVYYPIGAGRHVLALLASGDRLDLIKRIRCPTHVVHGIDDPLIPVEAGKELADIIEGATLQLVPGMGHDLAAGLMPIWVDAIGRHCLSVAEMSTAVT